MKLLNNFFNGNIKLWVSFWIIGLCYPFLVGFIFVFLHFTGILLIDSLEGTFYLMPSIFLILQIFVTIGVWRATNKYQGNRIYANLAKAIMLFVFVFIIPEFGKPWNW